MKVLIADEDPSLRFFLEEVVQTVGHQTVVARSGAEMLEKVEAEQPDLVLSGVAPDNVLVLEEVRQRHPEAVLVVLAANGTEELAARALEHKASNYLAKPVRFEALVSLLEKYDGVIRGRHFQGGLGATLVRRELVLRIGNDVNSVGEICDCVLAEAASSLPGESLLGLHLGLYELVMNAIEHGNLEITFDEKRRCLEDSPSRLYELIVRRQQDPVLSRRRVTISFQMADGRCEWTIADEGNGFDWEAIPNPFLDEHIQAVSGRGIYLARYHFDELEFLGKGNEVRAVKYLRRTHSNAG